MTVNTDEFERELPNASQIDGATGAATADAATDDSALINSLKAVDF